MRLTKENRQALIIELVNSYIGRDGNEFGILINDPDFAILVGEIDELRRYGQSRKWSLALTEWQILVSNAHKNFADHNGFGYLQRINYTELSFVDRKAYANAFKYALCFGAMNAQIGA